jgi:hypothetical protein
MTQPSAELQELLGKLASLLADHLRFLLTLQTRIRCSRRGLWISMWSA